MKRSMDKISRETVKSLKAASMSHDEKVSFKHLPNLEMVLLSDNYTSQVRSLLFPFLHHLEKEMAIHSSILAWRIPWMEEPGRLQSMWSQI